ncbi:metalloendopeptidase KNAG_0C00260 [Huiozyma naganishii CBS 8797]|uniref:Peptidase M3A/M3B catalytic domain-containing protein n=1 Tax=Huiozyma naganishii (strain ATCC MYA-139 / BCRC 22969 / CBS 8797 / KCTC 17520 / NBRC 10181 / NCYC 3082 / Yp74L-3) TaxID=1071383 RepID=J7S480_HUIN7|nr:hypothetical protein KNAG_0C00260 [Kazachstania naganishii CBS 8797]CCK69139.1 hypothetical protein KNAG_0C00260 [Kazachstania naganishii CBS 8797]
MVNSGSLCKVTRFLVKVSRSKLTLLPFVVLPTALFATSHFYQSSRSYSSTSSGLSRMSPQLVPPAGALPRWEFPSAKIGEEATRIIESTNKFYDELVEISNPSIDNLVKPYMNHENSIGLMVNQLCFLQHVSSDKEIREASNKATELLQNFEIETSLRHDLFLQFDKIWKELKPRKEEFSHDEEQFEIYKFVEKCHKDFVRAGLNLSEEDRNKVKDIKIKIASNSLEFSKNLGEQKEFLLFSKEQLDGVSDTVMEQFEQVKDETTNETNYKVTFKYPDIFPVLKMAKNAETRKTAFCGDQNKVPQNEELFVATLKLRDELATLLGYDTYANYNLEIKMAKKQSTVFKFLNDLKDKLKPLGEKEIGILKSIKEAECKELGVPFDGRYYIWDHRYYDTKYLKDNFNVDHEAIAEYYPIDSTIEGMLKIYETVFKLKFVEEKDTAKKNVWNEDVKQIAVWKMDNVKTPVFVGWIYFDLHPRDGKYGHAANFGIASSYIREDGSRSYPVTALVCNFSKSSATKPSLLKHNEITTFFHELGHGIHDLVGKNRAARFNGPGATPWDFVEAPSQMLEFYTWDKNALQSLSKHYKTGEQIPEKLLDSLIATKHVNGALFALRQLHFGLFDMTVHTSKDVASLDLLKLWGDLRQEISLVENGGQYTKGYDSFGHIMSDSYSAGYYGYMWAEVFATDMYRTKFAPNPLDSSVGMKYRDIVLANGGLYEIDDNLKEFLGREPSKDAFLKELGLQA